MPLGSHHFILPLILLTVKNNKSLAECLADEIIHCDKGNM